MRLVLSENWSFVPMIVRRFALFLGLLFGCGATQFPAFVLEYKQRLGGAIDQLASEVARFDSDIGQQGISEAAGIKRLRANADPLAQLRGARIEEDVARLKTLRAAQQDFRDAGPVARLATFVTHYDSTLVQGTWSDFEPAVPTTAEAFVLGALGFLIGGGAVHVAGRPFRRKRGKDMRTAEQTA